MTMPIVQKMRQSGNDIYYDDSFRRMFESHLPYIRSQTDIESGPLDPQLALKYTGDFQGLLGEMNVAPQYHWFYMRLNDMQSFEAIDTSVSTILVIPVQIIDQLVALYRTSVKKIA